MLGFLFFFFFFPSERRLGVFFFFSSRSRHTSWNGDWSSDVCSSDLGGGTFGIVTRVTLRSHPIPDRIGAVRGRITAKTDDAFRELVVRHLRFYETTLNNEHWGEQIAISGDNAVDITMTNLDL